MMRTKDKVEEVVWTVCWLHNVRLDYNYKNDDTFVHGIDDEGEVEDHYHDDVIDDWMRAVLQEWCGVKFDGVVGVVDNLVANENLNRFRACH